MANAGFDPGRPQREFEILVKVIVVFIDISNDVTHLYFIQLKTGIHLPVEMLEAIGKFNQFLYVGDAARGAQVNS